MSPRNHSHHYERITIACGAHMELIPNFAAIRPPALTWCKQLCYRNRCLWFLRATKSRHQITKMELSDFDSLPPRQTRIRTKHIDFTMPNFGVIIAHRFACGLFSSTNFSSKNSRCVPNLARGSHRSPPTRHRALTFKLRFLLRVEPLRIRELR